MNSTENFEILKDILQTIKKQIQNTTRNFKKEHYNEINSTNKEIENFIFKELAEVEKAEKKNLKKLKEFEEFIFLYI